MYGIGHVVKPCSFNMLCYIMSLYNCNYLLLCIFYYSLACTKQVMHACFAMFTCDDQRFECQHEGKTLVLTLGTSYLSVALTSLYHLYSVILISSGDKVCRYVYVTQYFCPSIVTVSSIPFHLQSQQMSQHLLMFIFAPCLHPTQHNNRSFLRWYVIKTIFMFVIQSAVIALPDRCKVLQ